MDIRLRECPFCGKVPKLSEYNANFVVPLCGCIPLDGRHWIPLETWQHRIEDEVEIDTSGIDSTKKDHLILVEECKCGNTEFYLRGASHDEYGIYLEFICTKCKKVRKSYTNQSQKLPENNN